MEAPCSITIDAVPNPSEFYDFNETSSRTIDGTYGSILDNFTIDDYKSVLFLLIDCKIKMDEFLCFVKQEKAFLKNLILEMNLDERIFIECLGTLKMYRELKYFGTCRHVFESKKQEFDEIDEVWKILYALCEEVTDTDLQIIKGSIPDEDILSAEEWFCYAIKYKIIKTSDISQLKTLQMFQNNLVCLNIIDNFRGHKLSYYKIRTPTTNSPSGIALIFNFEHFNNSDLKERNGSQVDVDSLEKLWSTFGFKTDIFKDLTSSNFLTKLELFSNQDHSKYDVFACCILSHGAPNVIYASDGNAILIHELIAIISKCKSLNGKPKLFFIQACQGSNLMTTEGCKYQEPCVPVGTSTYPIGIDVYVAVATLNGFASFRCPTNGTWFIQALYEAMMKYTDNCQYSLLDIMTHVTQHVAKNKCPIKTGEEVKQIVPVYSTLQKSLFLKRTY